VPARLKAAGRRGARGDCFKLPRGTSKDWCKRSGTRGGAAERLPEQEKIPHAESDRRLAAGNVYIFSLAERFAIDGSTPKNTARPINHSCDPNCQTEQFGNTIWIIAIRDIQAGEELTYNYGYELNDEPAEPCHCGAQNYCAYILGPPQQK
jgi:hypothetical protein